MVIVTDGISIIENSQNNLNNVIDKEVQSLLKPFNLIFALFVSSKYRIKYDVISANTSLYIVMSGVGFFVMLAGYFYSNFREAFLYNWEGINFTKYWCNICIYVIYFMCCVINYCTNVLCRNLNVLLVCKIQNICEILKVKGKCLKNLIKFNWLYVIILNIYHVCWIFFSVFSYSSYFEYYEFLTNYVYILFDMNVLHGTRVMKVMRQPLKVWLHEVRNSENVLAEENECFWNKMFRIYEETLETYLIFSKTFQPVILYYTVKTFGNVVITIALRTEIGKNTDSSLDIFSLHTAISLAWLVKNMLIITALVLECERFYSAMTDVWTVCLQQTSSKTSSDTQKMICKNIQRLQINSFEKINACGLFLIDSKFPLILCGLITSYTFVTLQFEFL